MLDYEHLRLPPRQGDSNMYILGELSDHNVVLAWLPGNQGKGAAAIVATNMARTFPSVKWRFLVGIGGGVPSDKHDIRLGDVVISMPEGQYGGVVQYDLGKDTEDGFQLKGFLCPPPTTLRNAVYMMQSDHLTKKNKVAEFLSAMVQKGPKLVVYHGPQGQILAESGAMSAGLPIVPQRAYVTGGSSGGVSNLPPVPDHTGLKELPGDIRTGSGRQQTVQTDNMGAGARYLLLCVNTRNLTKLLHVDLRYIENDQFLFDGIRRRYWEARRHNSWHYGLLTPHWLVDRMPAAWGDWLGTMHLRVPRSAELIEVSFSLSISHEVAVSC